MKLGREKKVGSRRQRDAFVGRISICFHEKFSGFVCVPNTINHCYGFWFPPALVSYSLPQRSVLSITYVFWFFSQDLSHPTIHRWPPTLSVVSLPQPKRYSQRQRPRYIHLFRLPFVFFATHTNQLPTPLQFA